MNAQCQRRYITVIECGLLLSAHPMTIRKWIDEKKIPAVRIGRAVRIDLKALESQLDQTKAGNP